MRTPQDSREDGALTASPLVVLPSASLYVYAARYALGRMSGAASDVEQAIAAALPVFQRDHSCREAIIRDIEEARDRDALGMEMDRECWMRTLGRLEACRG